jgi:peptide/nickel transport system substrate-binding protein
VTMIRTSATALTAAAMLVLAACGGNDDGNSNGNDDSSGTAEIGGPAEAERLRLGIISDEGNLTPHTYVTGYPGLNLMLLQYDTLMQVGLDGEPMPWLAEETDLSEDGLTYTLTLTDGVTWHDGEQLTSADVAFSVQYYRDTGTAGRFLRDLNAVDTVDTPDDRTVVFNLAETDPSFELRTLADVPILPEHIWSSIDEPDTAPFTEETSVGSGPYRLVSVDPGQSYEFQANENYFKGAPSVDTIVVVQLADQAGALSSLRSDAIDAIVGTVSPEQVDLLDGQQGLQVIQGPEFSSTLLAFDTQKPPFDDPTVRQAIALAIDRQKIVDDVYLGQAVPGVAGWLHPDSAWNSDDAPATEYDPTAANAMLDAAGMVDSNDDGVREMDGSPLSLDLLAASNNSLRLRVADLVAGMLGEVGINVAVQSVESTTWEEAIWPDFDVANGRNYDLAIWGWSAPVMADVGQMPQLVDSDPARGGLNVTGFVSERADDVGRQASTELDPNRRRDLIGELQDVFADEVPLVALAYPNGAYAVRTSVYAGWAFMTGQGVMHKLSFLPEDARG